MGKIIPISAVRMQYREEDGSLSYVLDSAHCIEKSEIFAIA